MIQETALRFVDLPTAAVPVVVCNNDHRFVIAEQLRAVHEDPATIILEPVGRNTAPAAAAAAHVLLRQDPDAIMAVLPADHAIHHTARFLAAVETATRLAQDGYLVTFGITPDAPHTGYGYIRRGEPISGHDGCFTVAAFVEKPDEKTAEGYVAAGDYAWNSGMFVFRADRYLEEMAALQPDMAAHCAEAVEQAEADMDFLRLDAGGFAACPSLSIDYAVMEHTKHAATIPVDIGWSDVGSWDALWTIGGHDSHGNVTSGDVLTHDVKDSYLRAENGMVAAIGVENLLVVETRDAVLVATRDRAQDVKEIVADIERRGRTEHAAHVRDYRPWGFFESIDTGERYQVKHLMVKPGAALSLQMHHHRAEHWVVVRGTARVTCGEEVKLLSENESVYIPIGTAHRLENPGKVPLDIIEVQSGSYLGEDDIVRFDDVYNRQD
jgi:mannose-1-phosphate guanylyltransferase/mannose-6-phosphate isomerase